MASPRNLALGQPCTINESQERWRPVRKWEALYEVSDFGRVRSVARWVACREGKRLSEGRLLQPTESLGMYWRVELNDGGRVQSVHVHRLVAVAFVPGIGAIVRHLDGNGFNNLPENLSWGSHADNEADKARHGRTPRGEAHPNSKMTDGHVRQIRELHSRGFNQIQIAKALGLNRGVVGVVVRGEGWSHVS